ncbi:hypothetical protein HY464_01135, partial [Candidatus Peregrinibacteria bacterium]|nr:hypothetical protein [Candidatus Peregrinibacteria bacterium]
MHTIFVNLTLAASLSPLLTFAHLWQLKEWRWDRLREHLRTEGYIRQLFGITRPAILGLGLVATQLSAFSFQLSASIILIAFTLLNTAQILLKKQPYPVWTRKAVTLVGTSLLLTGIAAQFSIFHSASSSWPRGNFQFSIFLPLLQPLILALALTLLFPIDHLLKQRILRHAKTLRIRFPNLTVIGITGSAGKTTTKELLAHILGPEAIATPEHVNMELGVARWLLKNLQPTTYNLQPVLIVEMGAYREGEIATLCSVAQPTMGIITSIGTQHIGLFGSQKAIAEAKGELFAALPKNGNAFINIDTP